MAKRAVVVGSGVFGVSGALALASRGWEVDLLDPGPLPRPEAASTDISKIVRMDYGADSLLTEWMERAIPLWRAWNRRWGLELYHQDGFLILAGAPFAPGGFEHDSLRTLAAMGHAVTRLDKQALAARYPEWNASRYPDGYFNPEAGWVESGRALELMIKDARDAGVRVRADAGMRHLLEAGGRVTGVAATTGEHVLADVVLLAAST